MVVALDSTAMLTGGAVAMTLVRGTALQTASSARATASVTLSQSPREAWRKTRT